MSASPQASPIKAIPTEWNGYKFRSRMEARWAVLFDSLAISFNYELEGYELPSGRRYLPDFFLPQIRMWAEVKPIEPVPAEKSKCRELCRMTGQTCLMLVGPPDFKSYNGISWSSNEFSECDYLLDIDYHARRYYERERRLFSSPGESFLKRSDFTKQYGSAVDRSRAERFDHASEDE